MQPVPFHIAPQDQLVRNLPLATVQNKAARRIAESFLADAWMDIAQLKAAVDIAKEEVAQARLQLVKAQAALADATRLTQRYASGQVTSGAHQRGARLLENRQVGSPSARGEDR